MEMEVQGVLLRELPVLNDMMHIFICSESYAGDGTR